MVAGAHRDALPVQHGADVVRMHAFDHEGKHAGLFPRRADQAQARNRLRALRSVDQQLVLVRRDVVHPDLVQVVERRAETDAARDIRRAGFELVRQIVVRGLLEGDRADHVAAALIGRHGFSSVVLP